MEVIVNKDVWLEKTRDQDEIMSKEARQNNLQIEGPHAQYAVHVDIPTPTRFRTPEI